MINNLDTQKRWVAKAKPYLPSQAVVDQLVRPLGPGLEVSIAPRVAPIPNLATITTINPINTPRPGPIRPVPPSAGAASVGTSASTTSGTPDHSIDAETSDIIASYESNSSKEKRQVCEIESDDELDQLLSKKTRPNTPPKINNIAKTPLKTAKIGQKTDKPGPKPGNILPQTAQIPSKVVPISPPARTSPALAITGPAPAKMGPIHTKTGPAPARTGPVHTKTGPVSTKTTDELYRKYINYLQLKANLLTERYMIFESSSISLDDKQKFIENTFNEKFKKLERVLASLAKLLPGLGEGSYESLERDLGVFESEQLNVVQDSRAGPDSSIQIPDLSRNIHYDSDDFSDFEITQVNKIDEGVETLIHSDEPTGPEIEIRHVSPEPRPLTRQVGPEMGPGRPHTPINSDEEEDNFGGDDMEGLRTPSQDVEHGDTDLSGFIAYGSSPEGSDYNSDLESIDETQELRVSRDEFNDMKLSQDVAENYGIEYIREEEEPEDEINDIDMTTQLNDEREVNYEVIEISDALDMEDMEDLSIFKPVKQENAVPVDEFDDFDDFDGLTSTKSNEKDDDLTELGITTSKDIIKEYERNFPGCGPYIKEIYSKLNQTFKLQNFRSNQFEAIISFLQGKDVFVLMPTGGGKSLCYQLPALVKVGAKNKGTTVVISPLISLMQDQVEHLRTKNVKAGMINSKNSYQEKKQMMELFRQGELDLVYLSPEMINSSNQIQRIIKHLYDIGMLSKVIVDEAHCISSWGHDFRPDYKGMNFFRTNYPDIPIMALTATANDKVRLDILHHLHMNQPVVLKQSFNRINLFYEIKMKTGAYLEEIKDLIASKYKNQTGIIYCHSKQSCEQISMKLNQYGLNTSFYHAGMATEDRFKIQLDWQQERIKVICATIAFGMGIDKPNVRFVIHSFIPRNLEGYYQETGRAGRDGLKSDCIMYYSYKDARTLQLMIQRDEEYSETTKENHLNKLRQVIQFCENKTDCRRKQILLYFNEVFNPKDCLKQCDACVNAKNFKSITKDVTNVSKDVIKLVQLIESEKVTLLYCQDIFKGLNYSKILKNGHNQLPFHGMGKSMNKLELERIFFHLISEDCLTEYSVFRGGFASNYVKVGKNAGQVLNGSRNVSIQLTEDSSRASTLGGTSGGSTGSTGALASGASGFVSAKTNQPIRLPSNNFSSMVNRFNEAHIDKCFKELNIIRIQKRNELNFQDSNSIITDNSLKQLSIILPTSKQEFKKFVSNNDQLSYFIYFKTKLTQLSNERKQLMKGQGTGPGPRSQGRSQGPRSQRPRSQGASSKANSKKSNYFKKRNKQKAMPL